MRSCIECGEELVRRPAENSTQWARRTCCSKSCAAKRRGPPVVKPRHGTYDSQRQTLARHCAGVPDVVVALARKSLNVWCVDCGGETLGGGLRCLPCFKRIAPPMDGMVGRWVDSSGSGPAARPSGDAGVACLESEGSALKRTTDNFINQERDSDLRTSTHLPTVPTGDNV